MKSPHKLANTTLIIGFDSEERCIHTNLLENSQDRGWGLTTIRNPKYRKLRIQKLIVLIFGSDGQISSQLPVESLPLSISPSSRKKKRKRETEARS
ncbi:MAG: hypothetical protein LBK99_14835 [Opitutaceae bacterium]|jgi:hypothetical protein|nr:hypothetical protein [Opitutaceae bacterium]